MRVAKCKCSADRRRTFDHIRRLRAGLNPRRGLRDESVEVEGVAARDAVLGRCRLATLQTLGAVKLRLPRASLPRIADRGSRWSTPEGASPTRTVLRVARAERSGRAALRSSTSTSASSGARARLLWIRSGLRGGSPYGEVRGGASGRPSSSQAAANVGRRGRIRRCGRTGRNDHARANPSRDGAFARCG